MESETGPVVLSLLCTETTLRTPESWGQRSQVRGWLSRKGTEEKSGLVLSECQKDRRDGRMPPPWQSLMKETVLACPNRFYLMANVNKYALLGVNLGFCGNECRGWEAHWLSRLSWSSQWGILVTYSRSGSSSGIWPHNLLFSILRSPGTRACSA